MVKIEIKFTVFYAEVFLGVVENTKICLLKVMRRQVSSTKLSFFHRSIYGFACGFVDV